MTQMTEIPAYIKLKPMSGATNNSFHLVKLELENKKYKNYHFLIN
jgi:hypothetical protein